MDNQVFVLSYFILGSKLHKMLDIWKLWLVNSHWGSREGSRFPATGIRSQQWWGLLPNARPPHAMKHVDLKLTQCIYILEFFYWEQKWMINWVQMFVGKNREAAWIFESENNLQMTWPLNDPWTRIPEHHMYHVYHKIVQLLFHSLGRETARSQTLNM